MTGKWRLLASAVVCLVAIVSAFHFLVMERHGVPDSGIRVVEQGNEEGGRDWVISCEEGFEGAERSILLNVLIQIWSYSSGSSYTYANN